MDEASFARLAQGFFIHVGEHQNRAIGSVLNNGADQARCIKARGERKGFVQGGFAHFDCLASCGYSWLNTYQLWPP